MPVRFATRRTAAALAAALAVMLGVSGCAAPQRVVVDVPTQVEAALADDTTQQLSDAVTFAMAAGGASGAIVGVWAPWSGSWVEALGTQSADVETPVTVDMDFRIGRITRAMTCDALYRTAAAGTVALDDPVTEYVPGVPQLSNVTLRQLCDSTSGVGNYTPKLKGMWLANPTRVWNPRELLAYGLGNALDGFTPGSGFVASDAGYVLLGLALERATGKTAAEILEDEVFGPLEMTGTQLPSGLAATPATTREALVGHVSRKDKDGVMNCTEPLDVTTMSSSIGFTDSGVVSNVTDVRTYVQALASGALLGDDQKRFDSPLPAYSSAPSWFTATGGAYGAGSLVGQFGTVPGYTTGAFADPKTGLTVVVVLNNSGNGDGLAVSLAWELAAIASKAAPASGQQAPEAGLPWTAEQYRDQIAAAAICPLPAA